MTFPRTAELPAALAQQLRQACTRAYPFEACGALLGSGDGLATPWVIESIAAAPNCHPGEQRSRFAIPAEFCLGVERLAQASGQDVIGYFHSHPDHTPLPSEHDRAHAWPGHLHLICTVEAGEPKEIAAYVLDGPDGTFLPVPLASAPRASAFPTETLAMAVSILIPAPLRRYYGGARSVEVSATTVGGALSALAEKSPEVRRQLFDSEGRLRGFVSVFLGDRNIRDLGPPGALIPVKSGDTITILPAVAGGAPEPASLSRQEILRYSRHLLMPEVTLEGQKKLKRARVLCVGVGGLGSASSLYLAAAGVGTLGLVEFDTVELTNLQRQVLYGTSDVGRPKLDAARERLMGLNPEIEVVPHPMRLSTWNAVSLFEQYDLVVDGTDNFATRYLISDACVLTGKPHVYGAIFRFEGQLSVFDGRRGPCYRCLFPEPPPPGLVPSCAEGGVLGVVPGVIGSLQALEAMWLILGTGDSLLCRILFFDALAFAFRDLPLHKLPDCPACGPQPTITEPIDYAAFCGVNAEEAPLDPKGLPILSVEDLAARRQKGEPFTLLDVRDPHEYDIAHIPGSTLIPLGELVSHLHWLDTAKTYTLVCHHGPRSVQAYRLLRQSGFGHLQILEGGVDAWALRVDPSVPRY